VPVLSLVMPFEGRSDIDFALALATKIAIREIRKDIRKAKRTGRRRKIPKLYDAPVRWQRDICRAPNVDGACERFLSPTQLLKEKVGDCDDMAPWRAAELILAGDKGARAKSILSPGVGYHVLVKHGDGTKEDPSRVMGMGRPKRKRRR